MDDQEWKAREYIEFTDIHVKIKQVSHIFGQLHLMNTGCVKKVLVETVENNKFW